MSEPLDPLDFAGCFAQPDSDLPDGISLAAWRSKADLRVGIGPTPAAGRAPQDRTLRARWRARRLRSGRGPDHGRAL